MLSVNHLCVSRGNSSLIQDLTFSVKAGQLLQIEGENGSGKTTLLRTLVGLITPDSGTISWNGESINDDALSFYHDLLFVGHQTGVKADLTAYENLRDYQLIHREPSDSEAIYLALAKVGLAGLEDVVAKRLSAGQQRRIALAKLWITSKSLWILDEPLTAIDKKGVSVIESLFDAHINQGGIVIFTTHQDLLSGHSKLVALELGRG